jgi:hypothetical protein
MRENDFFMSIIVQFYAKNTIKDKNPTSPPNPFPGMGLV